MDIILKLIPRVVPEYIELTLLAFQRSSALDSYFSKPIQPYQISNELQVILGKCQC